jgi:chromosomal replication initiator protein
LFSGLFSLPLLPADTAAEPARNHASEATQTFVAGEENALIRRLATAVSCAEIPYSPVALYGAADTGKTTVARALVALRESQFSASNSMLISSADLARELAHAVDSQSVNDFRSQFQRCDILFVDDIDRLVGKPAAQQFLLSTLDALIRRKSLVIVTLRKPPSTNGGLLPQLVSRLMGGLVVELARPGPLARRELIADVASRIGLRLTETTISDLAQCKQGDAESYLSALALRRRVLELAADNEFGRPKKRHNDSESLRRKAICRRAMAVAAKHFGFTMGELKSKSRRQALADARGLAMFVCRRVSGASFAEIGEHFGRRDHTTVLHACQKYEAIIGDDESTRRLADEFAAQIVGHGAN